MAGMFLRKSAPLGLAIAASAILATAGAPGPVRAQAIQGERGQTLTDLPQCVSEQGVPEKGIVSPGPPNPRAPLSLTNTAAAGQLDYGAYRWTMSGLRVRLCETGELIGSRDLAGAKARLTDAKIYTDALVLADKAFQVRAEAQRVNCVDYAKDASLRIGDLDQKNAEVRTAWAKLNGVLGEANKKRDEWIGRINATRAQIQQAIDDHNDRENSFWHQVGSFFGASSDDGIEDQLRTLNGIMSSERDELYKASLQASLLGGEQQQKVDELKRNIAQIDQLQRQLGTLKNAYVALDDARLGMFRLREAFAGFVDEMNADLPEDKERWQRIKTDIEKLQDAMFDFGESFPAGVLATCNPLAVTPDSKQVPW